MSQLFDALVGPLSNLVKTATLGVLSYLSLVLVLRVSGKRTLSKLNAFDLVVTVALGSCLATVLLSNDTSLLQGLIAFTVLVGMQYLVAWFSLRSKFVSNLVKAAPTLVYYRGNVMDQALRQERLTREELCVAARSSGLERLEAADAIILESDGKLSVLSGGESELTSVDSNVKTGEAMQQ